MKNKRKMLGLTAVASLLSLSAVLASCDKVKEYTVTFKNGTETVATQPVKEGYNATVPTAPTGATKFNGWYKDAALTTPFDFGSVITEDTTVYAKWVNNYTVTFNSNGGSSVASATVREGENVGVPTAPTGDTEFNGWYKDQALTQAFDFGSVITGNTTVYAKWINNYTVTFNSNGGSAVDPTIVREGSNVLAPEDPRKDDSEFAGWYKDAALTQPFDFGSVITGDTTVYAKWTPLPTMTSINMNGVNYATIAAALAAIPTDSTDTYVINLPAGTYEENGLLYDGSATIHIKGNTRALYGSNVVIKGHGSDMSQEKSRNLISIRGTGNIILENLTLECDWTRTMAGGNNAQAEVLGTDTKGYTVAYNCGFKSHQDTLRTAGKAWFYGCYIEGDVDFIWMEQAGSVALYENCEIVSVYDATATSHASYVAAPRMAKTKKVGKGLVIYNSTIRESAEAKENGQATYMARNPWSGSSDYYNQVAYINVDVEDIEAQIWYNTPTATEFEKTAIGYKMDQVTAGNLNYEGNNDILDADQVAKEFSGRETIINRVYNTGKMKYEKDLTNYWNINELIEANGWKVAVDTSKSTLDDEPAVVSTTYKFDGSQDLSALTIEGFAAHSSGSYAGGNGATIAIPVTGKCYVEVYGFYSGTVEAAAATQGMQVMFFNNGSTGSEVENDYIVYDETTSSVILTSKATTYITKIVVSQDATTTNTAVSDIEISANTKNICVGVPLTLSAKVTPGTAVNKSIVWSSSNEEVGVIDRYTGKVTFLKAGEVTFTATATDGSGITKTVTMTPIEAKWVAAEWYTTDKGSTQKLSEETGATEIGVFDVGGSSNKDLKLNGQSVTFTFTNIKGDTITTGQGLKLNSAGSLSFSTTKGNATLTVVTVKNINENATPIVKDGDVVAKLLDTTENADGTVTYLYEIPSAGAWKISRGDETKECNPILYAKVVYELRITKTTFVNFKGGAFKAEKEDAVILNHNSESTSKLDTTAKVTFDNFTYEGAVSNGNDNWLKFNQGATIKFTTSDICALKIRFYSGANNVKVTLNGTEVECSTASAIEAKPYVWYLDEEGEVVIEAVGNGYIGCFDVNIGEEEPEEEPEPLTTSKECEIVFGDNANIADVEGVTNTCELRANGNNSQVKNGTITLAVKAGAKVTVYGYGGARGTNNGDYTAYTVTANGETSETQNKDYVARVAADGNVVITPTDGNNYLIAIKVEYPLTTEKDVEIVFGNDTNIANIEGVTNTCELRPNGSNSQVKNGTITLAVKAGAKVTVYGYGGATGTNNGDYTAYTVTANGETSETQNKDYSVRVAADGNVVITPTDGNNYLMSIKIEYKKSTAEPIEIVFGNDTNINDFDGITNTCELRANGNNSQVKNGTITLAVKAGAKVTVYGYGGATGTNNGDYTAYTVTANGVTSETQNKDYSVRVAADGNVVITPTDGNNYLMSIKIEYPALTTYKNVTIAFGNDTNIADVDGVTNTCELRANGSNSQVKNGTITLAVAAGAKVTVYGYGGATGTNNGDYTAYTVTANGTTSETQNKDYEVIVTAEGLVVITPTDGNNYLMSIKIEYPTA